MRQAPRKILFVHASDEWYGSDVMLFRLMEGLDRARFQPLVVLPNDLPYEGRLSAALRKLGVPVWKADLAVVRRATFNWQRFPGFLLRLLWATLWLKGLIEREGVSVVQTNTLVVPAGALGALLARRPHAWHLHEVLTGPVMLRRPVGRILLSLADVVVANSQACRDSFFPPVSSHRRVEVVYDGVPRPRGRTEDERAALRRSLGIGDSDLLLLNVGRLSPRKGLEVLLHAVALVRRDVQGLKLVLVGGPVPGRESYERRLDRLVHKLGLAGSVTRLGFREDVSKYLDACDIFVMPSALPESFGLSAAEAMAAGKPVVASRQGGLAELISGGESGVLVPPGEAETLAKAIRSLSEDPIARLQMGAKGRKRIEQLFSLTSNVAKFQHIYESLPLRTSSDSSR